MLIYFVFPNRLTCNVAWAKCVMSVISLWTSQQIVFSIIFYYILATGLKWECFKLAGHHKELSFIGLILN